MVASPLFNDPEETNAIPWDLQEFVDANAGRKSPDTPEQIAQQEAYSARYGVRDENGNLIPGMMNQELFKQDYEALRNRYGEGSFLSNFLSVAAPLVMMAVPGIGQMIGSTLTGALGISASTAINAAIGNTVINTVLNGGDLEKAVKSTVGQWAGAEVGSIVGKSAADMFGSADAGKYIGNLASAGTRAAISGQDIGNALTGSAISGAVDFATSKIPGFSDLKPAVKNTITQSISTALQGGNVDFSKMLENATKEGFLSYGLSQIPDFDKANPSTQSLITTMLRTGISNGNMSQAALNWAINQVSTEFTNSVKSAPALEELKKAGFVDNDNYFNLSDDQKALVNRFLDAKDPRAAAAQYVNQNSTTAQEIEDYYKRITGQTTIPDDIKDLLKTYQGPRLDEEAAFTGLKNQLDVMRAADEAKLQKLNEGFANLKYDDRALADTMKEWGITPTFIERVTGKKYQDIVDGLNARVMHDDEVAANFKDVFGRDATDAEVRKYAGLSAYAARPQMQVDADTEATTFNARDYADPKEAAKAAKAAGFNNFTMPDGKTYVIQSPVDEGQAKDDIKAAQTFGDAFAQAREKLGAGKTFEWNGKLYSTNIAAESPYDGSRAGSMADAALLANQAGKSLFTYDGKTYKIPAGALDNIGNQSLAETKRLLGDQVKYATDAELAATGLQSKSLTTKPGDADTVSGKLANVFGIGARALGEQIQSFANAYSTATGTSYENAVSKVGASLEKWGDSQVSRDITSQENAINSAIQKAASGDWLDMPSTIAKAIKENPVGFLSYVSKEVGQEGIPKAGALLGGAAAMYFGAPIALAIGTGVTIGALIDGMEAFGSGSKEAYDAVINNFKKNNPNASFAEIQEAEASARSAALKNGAFHAAVTIPAEWIADKSLAKAYFETIKGGVSGFVAKYGSSAATNAVSEFIEGTSQNLSTQYLTTGTVDTKSAVAAGLFEGAIGFSVAGSILAPGAIKDATVIGKDYAGNNVTFKEFTSGTKVVDLNTLDPNAVVATNNQGQPVTLSGLTITAAGSDALSNDLKAILPASLTTNNTTVVGKDSGGNDITYGDIVSGKVQGTGNATSSVIRDYVSSGMSAPVNATGVTTPKTAITNIVSANPGLNATDVQNIVDLTLSQVPAGVTTTQIQNIVNSAISNLPTGATAAEVQTAITNATQKFVTMTDVQNAIAGIQFPAGLKKEDVISAITDYMKANPGLSIADVAAKVSEATRGLATSAEVNTSITNALKGVATKADIEAAIAGIQFPAGLTKADVTTAIQDYMKANPGLSLSDVSARITDATRNLTTTEDVQTSISNALKGYATKADIETAIAGIQFPAGLTKADVTQAVTDYMAANPGLKAKDVATAISDYMKANPAATPADVKKAVTESGDAIRADLAQTERDILAEVSKNEAAGLSRDQALQKAIDTVAANQRKSTSDILSKLNTTTSGLNTKITNLQADLAQTERDILAEVARNEAAGMSRDRALQKAIDTVAAAQKTSTAALTAKIGTVQTALSREISTQISGLDARLSAEIQAAIDSGLEGDAALQRGIDSLAAKMGTNQATLLANLNKSTTELKTQFSSQLASLDKKLSSAIADAKAAGLKGDAALQKAIATVAAAQKTSSADILSRLGKTEEQLRADFASEIGGVRADIASLNTSLSQAIADAKAAGLSGDAALQKAIDTVATANGQTKEDLLAALGKTEANLRSDFASQIGGVKADIAAVNTSLSQAIADAKAAGLQGDAALQAAINKVAGDLGTTSADLLSQIGKSATQLKEDFSSQLTGVRTDIAGLKTDLLAAIEDAKRSGLSGDAALQAAIDKVSTNLGTTKAELLSQMGTTAADLKKDFSTQLGTIKTDIDARIDTLMQQGLDQATATRQALDELKGQVSTGFSDVDRRINELMAQGQTYQQATTNALKELGGTVTSIQTAQKEAADQAAFQAATQKAMNLIGGPQVAPTVAAPPQPVSPLKQITTGGAAAVFSGPLQDYLKTVQTGYLPQQSQPEQQPMQNYFSYGQSSDIGQLLGTQEEPETQYAASGGLMATPLMASGGTTRYGRYAGGGLNVVNHSGKARVDFRSGDAVTGPGDGQSDDIPAMLADGEFVMPADVVAALGNGSTKAGSDKLYDMMHSIRAYHRSAKPKDLPPPAKKSPLDYLKKGRS